MVSVDMTFEQARVLRGLLNISGMETHHFGGATAEAHAAAEIGMDRDEVEDALMGLWKVLDYKLKGE